MGRLAVVVLALAVSAAPQVAPASLAGLAAAGNNHFYNLEYPQAIADYQQVIAAKPDSAAAWNHLAQAELYQEMYRIGGLESTLYGKSDAFLQRKALPPDPKAVAAFQDADAHAQALAQAEIKHDPSDAAAHYDLAVAYGIEGNFDFSVQKSYWSALGDAKNARREAEKAHQLKPRWIDPLLIIGVQNYVAGSLPWTVKVFSTLVGYRGNKQKGIAQLQEVAAHGEHAQTDARVLLGVVDRREGLNAAAAKLFAGLNLQYPRNYLFAVESGEAWEAAGNHTAARAAFHNVLARAQAGAPGYARAPRAQCWYDLGKIAMLYSNWPRALTAFHNAEHAPNAPPRYLQAARLAAAQAQGHRKN